MRAKRACERARLRRNHSMAALRSMAMAASMLNLRGAEFARFRRMPNRFIHIAAPLSLASGFALALGVTLTLTSACAPAVKPTAPSAPTPAAAPAPAGPDAIAPDVAERVRQFPRTRIDFDRALLPERETEVLELLIDASRELEGIYARQVAEEVPSFRESVARMVSEHRPRALPA